MFLDQTAQLRETQHLALRVVRFDQPITIEQQRITRLQHNLFLLVGHPGQQAQRHAARPQFLDAAGSSPNIGHVMPGVGVAYVTGRRVDDGIQAGDEHLGRDVRAEYVIRARQHIARRHESLRCCA